VNTFVIAKRELSVFFVSPVAYVVGAAFLFITGLFFVMTLAVDNVATLNRVFLVISIMLLFLAPLLTMRLLAEEARSGTLELLLTAPVRDWEVVLGKFLAVFIYFIALLVPTLYYLFLLTRFDTPDIPVTLSGYLGVILLGAMLIGLGVLTSAVSTNQIVAVVLGIIISVAFWMIGGLSYFFPGSVGNLLKYLSIQEHLFDFLLGLISSTNVIYFLTITAASLFLAARILEMRRWR
jgi:ABC-2 type transport system permease protein